ncbi:hypothetical protein V1511DRAFT_50295 [Dipodascopsis uninucleata]
MDCNSLFLEWLGEWQVQLENLGSKSHHTYKKAISSLRSCPIAFSHPSELLSLKGFGPAICGKLEKKLSDYCMANNVPIPVPLSSKAKERGNGNETSSGTRDSSSNQTDSNQCVAKNSNKAETKKAKAVRKQKQYIPQYRTGAYAILLALHEFNTEAIGGETSISKQDIIRKASHLCDNSFEIPSGTNRQQTIGGTSGSRHTAWSGIKMLLKHELVIETGKRGRYTYQISEHGIEVAESILKVEQRNTPSGTAQSRTPLKARLNQSTLSFISSPSKGGYMNPQGLSAVDLINKPLELQLPSFTATIWEPGSFCINVIIDNREIQSQKDREFFVTKLNEIPDVSAETRALGLGDTLWIAKNLSTSQEVVLSYIAERKRLDDLISSICDGRFHEQKYRLMRSGLSNVIYIVEESPGVDIGNFLESVQTAIASTQVVNEFFLKRTTGIEDTIRYLGRLTRKIKQTYESRPLHIIPDAVIDSRTYLPLLKHLQAKDPHISYHISFETFNSATSKNSNLTIRDVFLRMLLTIRGLSWEKAIEIQKQFPTPHHLWSELVEEYTSYGEHAARELVMRRCNSESAILSRKRIGPALSSKIAEIWGPIPQRPVPTISNSD